LLTAQPPLRCFKETFRTILSPSPKSAATRLETRGTQHASSTADLYWSAHLEENPMDNRFRVTAAKGAAAVVALTALVAVVFWARSGIAPKIGNADEGEFLLVEASERELDGAPALSLTFTLPLDARQSYDKYVRVFEMPAPPRRPDDRRF